jgi:hypothetical protein
MLVSVGSERVGFDEALEEGICVSAGLHRLVVFLLLQD